MSNNEMAISTKGLVKRFGEEVLAVDSIDLSIPPNTIYALLGPNGAGKTTTVSMLTTLIEPTSGRAQSPGWMLSSRPTGSGSGSGSHSRKLF